jgi:glutamate racemase
VNGSDPRRTAKTGIAADTRKKFCVGVLDSGIGGVSVLRAIHASLPQLDLLYVADSQHAPYGSLRDEDIRERARCVTEFLFQQGADAVVLACNTATAVAIQNLRRTFSRPLVGVEPAIKPALERTRTGQIGILATQVTLGSERFRRLCDCWSDRADILTQPCPDLVREVERGNWDGAHMRFLLQSYIDPLLAEGVDTLVLGCTHYHFLKSILSQLAGSETAILDPCYPVAKQLARVLCVEKAVPHPEEDEPSRSPQFWTSGDTAFFQGQLDRIWGRNACVKKFPL